MLGPWHPDFADSDFLPEVFGETRHMIPMSMRSDDNVKVRSALIGYSFDDV